MLYMNHFQIICLNLIMTITYSLLSLIMKKHLYVILLSSRLLFCNIKFIIVPLNKIILG